MLAAEFAVFVAAPAAAGNDLVDAVKFLTKDINTNFVQFLSDKIRKEIHSQTDIPDLTDEAFGGNLTGVAMAYKLFGLETICAKKESYFREALYDRLVLIDKILTTKYEKLS